MPHRLDRDNVHGPFKLEKGRLTFRTGDAALTQRLQADRAAGRDSTVCLLSAAPVAEFTGRLETVELVKVERPQEWEVVMTEAKGSRGRDAR
jgi:hypothetical protein